MSQQARNGPHSCQLPAHLWGPTPLANGFPNGKCVKGWVGYPPTCCSMSGKTTAAQDLILDEQALDLCLALHSES